MAGAQAFWFTHHILSESDTDAFIEMTEKLELAKEDLGYYETRWLELEEKKKH